VFAAIAWINDTVLCAEVTGPAAAGQDTDATIQVPDDWTMLTGRVLSADGAPLTRMSLAATGITAESAFVEQIVTDADGGFVMFLGNPDRTGGNLESLTITRSFGGKERQRGDVGAHTLVCGRNDLGDIRLHDEPLIVAGRFVLERPSRLQLDCEVQHWVDGQAPDGQGSWQTVEDLLVSRDDQRRFEVRGAIPSGRLRLCCKSRGHLPVEPVEFTAGKDDLVIPIGLGYSLDLHCRLPEGTHADSFSFDLVPSSGRPMGNRYLRPRSTQSRDVCHLDWPVLRRDSYVLEVRLRGCPSVLASFAGLQVPRPDGEPVPQLDLCSLLQPLTVRVELAGGRPPRSEPLVFLGPPAELKQEDGHRVVDGSVTLVMPPQPCDLTVTCEGWQAQKIRTAAGPLEVRLQPWPVVQVAVQGLPTLPADVHAWVSLERAGTRVESQAAGIGDLLDAPVWQQEPVNGAVELPIGNAPRRIAVGLTLDRMPVYREARLHSLQPATVEPGCRSLSVNLSADEVAAAIALLQRPR
jgi:hypothetical protein